MAKPVSNQLKTSGTYANKPLDERVEVNRYYASDDDAQNSIRSIESMSGAYVGLHVYVTDLEKNGTDKRGEYVITKLTSPGNDVDMTGVKSVLEFIGAASQTSLNTLAAKVDKLPVGMYYGSFASVENLPDAEHRDYKGYAYVPTTDAGVYYIYTTDGNSTDWVLSENKFYSTNLETNLANKSEDKAPTTKIVAEGIEESDLRRERTTALSAAQKYQVNANISDRIADIDQQTSEVKALGYKVLNPNISFTSQVTEANMVYDIRDEFDLGTKVTLSGNDTAVTIDGNTYYPSTMAIQLQKDNGIRIPQDIVVLNENKTAVVSKVGSIYIATANDGETLYTASTESNGDCSYILLGNVTILESTLKFNGGKIKNARIVGTNTIIDATNIQIFDGVVFGGTFKTKMIAEWLLPKYDNTRDYSSILTDVFNCGATSILFTAPYTYTITKTIVIEKDIDIDTTCKYVGSGYNLNHIATATCIKSTDNLTILHYKHSKSNTKVNIGGLVLVSCDKNNPSFTTPICKLEMVVSGWQGVYINFTCISNYNTYKYLGNGELAPSSSEEGEKWVRIGMIGLEVTGQETFTLSTIDGYFFCYKALYVHLSEQHASDAFITDIKVPARIEANYGGEINGSPITFNGFYQPIGFPTDIPSLRPTECFFYGGARYNFQNIVWDLSSITNINKVKTVVYSADSANYTTVRTQTSENIPNLPISTSTNFTANDRGIFNKIEDLTSLTISVSQDNFENILYTQEDILNKNGLFNLFYKRYSLNNGENTFPEQLSAFINPNSISSNPLDFTKNIQIKYVIRTSLKSGYLVLNTDRALEKVYITRKVYSDNYQTLIYNKSVDLTKATTGTSTTNRVVFYALDTISAVNEEVTIDYEIKLSSLSYSFFGSTNKTFFLFGFNYFNLNTNPNKGTFFEANEIYTDKIIYKNNLVSGGLPVQRTLNALYVNGFNFIAPSTISGNIDIKFSYAASDGNNKFSPFRSAYLKIKSDGTVYLTGVNKSCILSKKNHEITGLVYYSFLIEGYYCSVDYISGREILDFKKREALSDASTVTINYSKIRGTTAERPTFNNYELTFEYYDTTIGKRIYYTGGANGKWIDSSGFTAALGRGTTNNRPTSIMTADDAGYRYFDTTLGKDITWNGTAWIDGNGETVGLQVKDTTILLEAAESSSKIIDVYSSSAITATVQNPDGSTTDLWLTASVGTLTSGAYPVTLTTTSANSTNPRGAKVIISNGTDVIIVNVVQNYSTT